MTQKYLEWFKTNTTVQQEFQVPQTILNGAYILQRFIGRGGFGHVYEGLDTTQNRQVCLKIVTKDRIEADQVSSPTLQNEASILRDIKHPNIVRVHNFVEETNITHACGDTISCSILCIELCLEMNLQEVVRQNLLSELQKTKICVQLVEAMQYLHLHNIIHCDVKPSNVLLDQNYNAKIADFGLSHRASYVDVFLQNVGTPYSKPPEMYQKQYYDQRIDIWGLGIVIFFIFAEELPFPQQNAQMLKNAIEKCQYDIEKIHDGTIRQLIQMMLTRQADRAYVEDVTLDLAFTRLKQLTQKC